MANTDINPEVVAEIANEVAATLDSINGDFDTMQTRVFNKIQESWYNENALKVMPGCTNSMSKLSQGINSALASLGKALGAAANGWAEANGAAGYNVRSIGEAARTMSCAVQDNKNGFRGMDVDDIQTAVDEATNAEQTIIERLSKLRAAGNRVGFRGGNMQAQLTNVCNTLSNQVKNGITQVIEDITTNTGTAKSNVISAKSATEATFTIE